MMTEFRGHHPEPRRELAIPDRAFQRAEHVHATRQCSPSCSVADLLDAAAPLVVAAELRQIAKAWQPESPEHELNDREAYELDLCANVARSLRARADELDGGAS